MNIIELFDKAKQNLKYPKYTYLVNNRKIQFSLAGPNASRPGTLNITDGGAYGSNIFYGRVARLKDAEKVTPIIEWNGRYGGFSREITELIERLVNNPVEEGKLFGQKYAYCCFCAKEITTKESLAAGYGPVCAAKWGLPWGNYKEEEVNADNL
jgi:hypothetical protein